MKRKTAAKTPIAITIGNADYHLPPDLLALDNRNLAILGQQITQIPADLAYVGELFARAERELRAEERIFDTWFAGAVSNYDDLKGSEATKIRQVKTQLKKKYEAHQDKISSAAYVVRLIRSYKDAMEAKRDLAQTLAANLRSEREGYKKHD